MPGSKNCCTIFFRLDVYLSIADVANKRKFVFPKALEKGNYELKLEGLYHPELKTAVSNDFTLNASMPMVFLTGANMAGKSTFLRSLSTAVYIAHMGFPVAASFMSFPVMDGIYTTINLPDNLGIGASRTLCRSIACKSGAGTACREGAVHHIRRTVPGYQCERCT